MNAQNKQGKTNDSNTNKPTPLELEELGKQPGENEQESREQRLKNREADRKRNAQRVEAKKRVANAKVEEPRKRDALSPSEAQTTQTEPSVQTTESSSEGVVKSDSQAGMMALSGYLEGEPAAKEEEGPSMAEMFTRALMTSSELQKADIPARKDYLGGWLCEGDYGVVFAPRGVGKTWASMAMAHAMAANEAFGPWAAGTSKCKVLYVDGEMPLALTKARDVGLSRGGELIYLHHDTFYEQTEKGMNLAKQKDRDGLKEMVIEQGINVLFLDNLSTLAHGIQENDASEWEALGNWFLELRRMKLTVVLVHHAGRNGQMRGTSKREDMAAWILSLTSDAVSAGDEGAQFVSHFAKRPRVMADSIHDFGWKFTTDEATGVVAIEHTKAQPADRFKALIVAGVGTNSELAEELGISSGQVSKLAKKGLDAGWLKKVGRSYVIKDDHAGKPATYKLKVKAA